MNLMVLNRKYCDNGVSGSLAIYDNEKVNSVFSCVTLERPLLLDSDGNTLKGESCIPEGYYSLGRDHAGRFYDRYVKNGKFDGHEYIPMVADGQLVNRSQILFHVGNQISDSQGCILIGSYKDREKMFIYQSSKAYDEFYKAFHKYNPQKLIVTSS